MERPDQIELSFSDVDALTISFVDAFLGRFLTELTARRTPVLVLLSGLTEDTASEIDAVMKGRRLVVAAIVDSAPSLLGADHHLQETFVTATGLGRFTPNQLADRLGTTPQNANNRLKRLVDMGAIRRFRRDPSAGGREYAYEIQEGIPTPATT
jgi:MarR family protein